MTCEAGADEAAVGKPYFSPTTIKSDFLRAVYIIGVVAALVLSFSVSLFANPPQVGSDHTILNDIAYTYCRALAVSFATAGLVHLLLALVRGTDQSNFKPVLGIAVYCTCSAMVFVVASLALAAYQAAAEPSSYILMAIAVVPCCIGAVLGVWACGGPTQQASKQQTHPGAPAV